MDTAVIRPARPPLPLARQYTPEFMERERPFFEADIRAHWPNRSLLRYTHGYVKSNTNCQWLGWLQCASARQRVGGGT